MSILNLILEAQCQRTLIQIPLSLPTSTTIGLNFNLVPWFLSQFQPLTEDFSILKSQPIIFNFIEEISDKI